MIATLTTFKKATRRGLTLIEALLFLGIAAVVIVGAVVLYNNASNSARTNDALTQIQSYTTGVKGLFSSQPNYGSVAITPSLIAGGLAPRNAVRDATTLSNPWGDETAVVGAGSTFHVYIQNVPQDACVRILTAGLMSQGSINNIWTVAGTTGALPTTAVSVPAAGTRSFDVDTPPTPATATAACSDTNNNIYMNVR